MQLKNFPPIEVKEFKGKIYGEFKCIKLCMKDVRNKNEDFRIAESKMQYNQHISLDPFPAFFINLYPTKV